MSIFAALALSNLREPWLDEAMLAYNFVVGELSVFEPLPYYEQAAPAGYTAIVSIVTENAEALAVFDRMRVASLIAFCFGLIAIASIFRNRVEWVALVALFGIVFSSPVIWQYAVEIKHYSFEFFMTVLVIVAGQRFAVKGASTGFLFTAMIAPLFSFTAPLVIAGTATTIVVFRLFEIRRTSRGVSSNPRNTIRPLLAVNTVAVVWAAAIHLLLNRGLVHYQMTAYSDVYESGLADLTGSLIEAVKILTRLPEYLLFPLGQESLRELLVALFYDGFILYALIALGSFLVLAAIVAISFRRAPFFAALTVVIAVLAIVLNLFGMLPFQHPRHFIFLAPLILILTAVTAQFLYWAIFRSIGGSARKGLALLGVFVVAIPATLGAYGAFTARSPELLPVIRHISDSPTTAPVWVSATVQPMARMVAPEGLHIVELLENRSMHVSWLSRSKSETLDAAKASRPIWLVFPIVRSLDPTLIVHEVEASGVTCDERLVTNGTRLFFCL